jgi:colanic acid biosynthesis glycosyl transferase WcaI
MTSSFARYSPAKRIVQEVRYGRQLGTLLQSERPDVVISTNTSLLAHSLVARSCSGAGIPMILWQQDVVSVAIQTVLRRKVGPILGWPLGRLADQIEKGIAARSQGIATISSDFLPMLERWGVSDRATVIPNWAPLPELPLRPRDNAWARRHGLVDRPVVLYTGTLGLKHDPAILVALAKRLRSDVPNACVVVVSEGSGRDWLATRKKDEDLENLILLDYQPNDSYPDVMATADVLIALLEPAAGQYSVPSKVLSYLCAARPLVAVMPMNNAATATVRDSGGGEVVQDDEAAIAAVLHLLRTPDARSRMGSAGRYYAESAFDVAAKADRFAELIWTASSGLQPQRRYRRHAEHARDHPATLPPAIAVGGDA